LQRATDLLNASPAPSCYDAEPRACTTVVRSVALDAAYAQIDEVFSYA
jgi:hypothetical protein